MKKNALSVKCNRNNHGEWLKFYLRESITSHRAGYTTEGTGIKQSAIWGIYSVYTWRISQWSQRQKEHVHPASGYLGRSPDIQSTGLLVECYDYDK